MSRVSNRRAGGGVSNERVSDGSAEGLLLLLLLPPLRAAEGVRCRFFVRWFYFHHFFFFLSCVPVTIVVFPGVFFCVCCCVLFLFSFFYVFEFLFFWFFVLIIIHVSDHIYCQKIISHQITSCHTHRALVQLLGGR